MKPDQVTIRSYQVGFGDCYLMSFRYPDGERHVLVDFGSTGTPEGITKKAQMVAIADDIAARVKKEPFAIVATHRHQDHISGFTTGNGKASGDIIKALKPKHVTQPWTEDPKLKVNATGPGVALAGVRQLRALHAQGLDAMQAVAGQFYRDARRLRGQSREAVSLKRQLEFLGENNIANLSAVKNLMTMATNEYVFYGKKTKLSTFLPGVKVDVLGPPTVDQSEGVAKQRARDKDEFWHLMAAAQKRAHPDEANSAILFPDHVKTDPSGRPPIDTRWFIQRARKLKSDEMLRIVRALDHAMNNTSVILLFRAGSKSLLFPGDAQLENWQYALSQKKTVNLLKKVDLYKVGHHGSLNATPKSLWALFERKDKDSKNKLRLKSLMSTMEGKHGDEDTGTEVPRSKLTRELRSQSDHFTTQSLPVGTLSKDTVIKLT
jgi:hypothetical protein